MLQETMASEMDVIKYADLFCVCVCVCVCVYERGGRDQIC